MLKQPAKVYKRIQNPKKERGKAFGVRGSISTVASILGPLLEGLLIDFLGWQWIFFINIPLGIIVVVLGLYFLPCKEKTSAEAFRFDWIGTLFALIALIFLMITFLEPANSSSWQEKLPLLFICVIFRCCFILYERRRKEPGLFPMQLMNNRRFIASALLSIIVTISVFGVTFLSVNYVQNL